jgi:hypothetical protein
MPVSTIGSAPTNPATSCKEILEKGASKGDGVYWLKPSSMSYSVSVKCGMTNQGGGWTVIDISPFHRMVSQNSPLGTGSFQASYVLERVALSISQQSAVELDLKVNFTEYMLAFGLLASQGAVDTKAFTNEAFLQNSVVAPDQEPDVQFGGLGEEVLNSIREGEITSTTEIGALALGTDKQIHQLKSGGELGIVTDVVVFDTIEHEHFMQATPETSKLRFNYYAEDGSDVTLFIYKILIR